MVIYKYPIKKLIQEQTVMLPKNARILHVNEQANNLYLWAQVDPNQPEEARIIKIYGTGHPLGSSELYIGTLLRYGGHLVLHFYEVL